MYIFMYIQQKFKDTKITFTFIDKKIFVKFIYCTYFICL